MAFCGKCGNKLKKGAKFCPKCGTKINRETTVNKQTYTCGNCGKEFVGQLDCCPHCGTKINWGTNSDNKDGINDYIASYIIPVLGVLPGVIGYFYDNLIIGIVLCVCFYGVLREIFEAVKEGRMKQNTGTRFILALAIIGNLGFFAYVKDWGEDIKEMTNSIEYKKETATTMMDELREHPVKAQKKYMGEYVEVEGKLELMDSEGEYFNLDFWFIQSFKCIIPEKNKSYITDKLCDMNDGDIVIVRGKITDMGEVMGYELTVSDVKKK